MEKKYFYEISRDSVHSLLENVIFLDIKTIKLNTKENEIVEIVGIKILPNTIEVFETLVRPNHNILSEVYLPREDLNFESFKSAPKWRDVKPELLDFIEDKTIIYYDTKLEFSFFKENLFDYTNKSNKILNSMELAMLLKPNLKSFNLKYLIKELSINERKEDNKGILNLFYIIDIVNKLIISAKKEAPYILKNIESLLSDWQWYDYIVSTSILVDFNDQSYKNKERLNKHKNITKSVNLELYEELLKKEELWRSESHEYSFREQQYEMSKMIKQALKDNKIGIIQSPTGTGKTVAYTLTSAIYSFYKNEKIFISTQTKALQNQLIEKDIPYVLESLNLQDSINLLQLKGKSNYICKLLINDFQKSISIKKLSLQERLGIVFIKNLVETGKYGDIEDISYLAKAYFNLDIYLDLFKINENFSCNSNCRFDKSCFYKNQIRKLKEANIVVINHSLLLMWPYECEYGKINKVIIDEAHNLPNTIREVHSIQVDNIQTSNKIDYLINTRQERNTFYNKYNQTGLINSLKGIDLKLHKDNIQDLEREAKLIVKTINEKLKYQGTLYNNKRECYMSKDLRKEIEVDLKRYSEKLEIVYKSISNNIAFIKNNHSGYYNSLDTNFVNLIRDKIKELMQIKMNIDNYLKVKDDMYSCSIIISEESTLFSIKAEPLNINALYYKTFLKEIKSCILTSATLTLDKNLNNFKSNLGIDRLDNERILEDKILNNIYDYDNNTVIAIPNDTPKFFKDKNFQTSEEIGFYVGKFIIKLLGKTRGNILVLTTSKRRLEFIKSYVDKNIYNFEVEIITNKKDIYKVKENKENKRFIIIGSKSFFEGVDIPGDYLNCVVLEKIPNLVPTSPLVQAFKNNNINYNEINRPYIEILIKQAFGRLIRSKYDYGYFFILNGVTENNKDLLYKIKSKNIIVDSQMNIFNTIDKNYEIWEIRSIESVLRYVDKKYNIFNIKDVYDLCEIINAIFLKRNIKCKFDVSINKNNQLNAYFLYRDKIIQNNKLDTIIKNILLKIRKD